MNNKQIQLIVNWLILIGLIVIGSYKHEWVNENWDWLRWPLLIVIIIIATISGRESTGWGNPGVRLQEFIEDNKILKAWVIIASLSILVFLSISFNLEVNLSDYSGTVLLVGFGVLLLPLIIVSECKRFKRLGKKSNK